MDCSDQSGQTHTPDNHTDSAFARAFDWNQNYMGRIRSNSDSDSDSLAVLVHTAAGVLPTVQTGDLAAVLDLDPAANRPVHRIPAFLDLGHRDYRGPLAAVHNRTLVQILAASADSAVETVESEKAAAAPSVVETDHRTNTDCNWVHIGKPSARNWAFLAAMGDLSLAAD